MTDELKPCPFCGGSAELRYHPSSRSDPECRAWEAGCSICDARVGSTVYAIGKTKEEAIAAWNTRRAPDRPRDEAVDYLCDMCANDCDERREIRVGQGAYDVCASWKWRWVSEQDQRVRVQV